jgi:hypothetical protein
METVIGLDAKDMPIETWKDTYEVLSVRVGELHKEIDKFQNIIFVNRNNVTRAKRKIRLLERGIKLIAKGNTAKAIHLFDIENAKHFNDE